MSSRTKIVVLRMKEIIYTAIFIGLALLLIILFFFMLRTRKADSSQTTPSVSSTELKTSYISGVYSDVYKRQAPVSPSRILSSISSSCLRLLISETESMAYKSISA